MSRAESSELRFKDLREGAPVRAPKQERATTTAKTTPPARPKRAQPKSSATVLLFAIAACEDVRVTCKQTSRHKVTLSRTEKYATFTRMNKVCSAVWVHQSRRVRT